MMIESLISVYGKVRDHLDAFTFSENIIPELIEVKRYIPELHKETLLIHRLYFAEKWLVQRLHLGHVDPREAGVGNMVNCGAAMYMAPVGIVNAGDPEGAYKEAIEIAGAHQSSYGREAAGVFAACVAQSLIPNTGVNEIINVAIELANDGTKQAIESVAKVAKNFSNWQEAIHPLRAAFKPYDTMTDNYREQDLDSRKPSRKLSIEELPIALGMLIVSDGKYEGSVLGGVNYGRDSDSIASMAGALAGALSGISSIPKEWLFKVETASKRDFGKLSEFILQVTNEIREKDLVKIQNILGTKSRVFN
jgi:ADP-ribosylglycohydrolase